MKEPVYTFIGKIFHIFVHQTSLTRISDSQGAIKPDVPASVTKLIGVDIKIFLFSSFNLPEKVFTIGPQVPSHYHTTIACFQKYGNPTASCRSEPSDGNYLGLVLRQLGKIEDGLALSELQIWSKLCPAQLSRVPYQELLLDKALRRTRSEQDDALDVLDQAIRLYNSLIRLPSGYLRGIQMDEYDLVIGVG